MVDSNNLKTEEASTSSCVPSTIAMEKNQPSEKVAAVLPDLLNLDPLPPSPASSLVEDATFEPTVDMMVNDFDDEMTLNEEEALAEREAINPQDEIDKLKEESEMPIEELLAMYRTMESAETPTKRKKYSKKRITKKKCKLDEAAHVDVSVDTKNVIANEIYERTTERELTEIKEMDDNNGDDEDSVYSETDNAGSVNEPANSPFPRRSHLMDLYPDQAFENVPKLTTTGENEVPPLEILYGNDDGEEDEDEEEDAETESEDTKRKIMVGASYQADIPDGLSQYGDILPYENEDKLIWEPSQVSESEVEGYLVKIQDMKSDEEESSACDEKVEQNLEQLPAPSLDKCENEDFKFSKPNKIINKTDAEISSLVKDSEQALHLLVQCGYDFNEALRRKKLNALPLTDSMSLWSQDECLKFEEGIQKYGKDFFKIRQNQVRTRTMRELVYFYYLWKKSERRDQTFANTDTIDHMDVFLNESNDLGAVGTGSNTGNATNVGICASLTTRRGANRNMSMMTANNHPNSNNSNQKRCTSVKPTEMPAATPISKPTTNTVTTTEITVCLNATSAVV